MINKTQAEIMRNWKTSADKPTVSVICNTYNQSRYIGSALDSFLMQETDFPFEVIVHEDASVDNTADIIREYEKKFPDIIKPIYEKENQYSKNRDIVMEIDLPAAGGKYIAFCEGDDYWTDKTKLQKSFDYMEKHDECSLVSHLTNVDNGVSKKMTQYNPDFMQRGGIISSDEVIIETNLIHTSSLFFRKSFLENNKRIITRLKSYDAVLVMLAATEGYVYLIPETMSVYRFRAAGSWNLAVADDDEKLLKVIEHLCRSAETINKYRNYKFSQTFKERNRRASFGFYKIKGDIPKLLNKKYRDLYKKASIADHIMILLKNMPEPARLFFRRYIRPHLWGIYLRFNESGGFSSYKR
ncbi:MAG: glycosyltransferase [Firmicutes bacterium]|nr:glycosyltransferase [Bacillota bacterium]